jgi:hypothetical protein
MVARRGSWAVDEVFHLAGGTPAAMVGPGAVSPLFSSLRGSPDELLNMKMPGFEMAVPFSDAEIEAVERVLGHVLPDDYRHFVKTHGGAFIGGRVDGDGARSVLAFFEAGEERGLLAKLRTHPDLRADGVLPIADCELGNLYVLDASGAVHYIDYYGRSVKATKLSDSFAGFLSKIIIENE